MLGDMPAIGMPVEMVPSSGLLTVTEEPEGSPVAKGFIRPPQQRS